MVKVGPSGYTLHVNDNTQRQSAASEATTETREREIQNFFCFV
jgi:hypothetical protein